MSLKTAYIPSALTIQGDVNVRCSIEVRERPRSADVERRERVAHDSCERRSAYTYREGFRFKREQSDCLCDGRCQRGRFDAKQIWLS